MRNRRQIELGTFTETGPAPSFRGKDESDALRASLAALTVQVRQADERGDEAMRRAHAAEARAEELERALGELVALEDIRERYSASRPDSPRSPNWRRYLADVDDFPERERLAWAAARALVARGIVSPEGIETGTGSTAQPREPGPAGARPSKGFLKGESPQATWPFAQDDKGSE